ncbi:MAG: GNAT family N-acetyltransferase [Kofleriaceae bacterium]|nr:GNAT family N-acetyltransferase [Kofleriaceae bacterium]
MLVRSLGLTTELALAATRGTVTDRGDYLVVETPDDPGYYHGNVLVLPAAPQVGEVAYWTRRWGGELGRNKAIKHVTLWWDGIAGDVGAAAELTAAGFQVTTNQVMVADAVEAPQGGFDVRPLAPSEISATADLAWANGDRHDEPYRQFLQRRAAWQHALVSRGAATFWGGFDGTELVASLGLVPVSGVARYQDVQTLASHRRRGLAGALLAAAARHALANGAARVVIVAEPDSEASRVYSRVGFRTLERTASALRPPP